MVKKIQNCEIKTAEKAIDITNLNAYCISFKKRKVIHIDATFLHIQYELEDSNNQNIFTNNKENQKIHNNLKNK